MRQLDIWVEPPSGWHYGFPKIKKASDKRDMETWLIDNGYPKAMIGLTNLDFVRTWSVNGEDE